MIAFVSLFLGLLTGPQTVELAVAEKVASVELRLDGAVVGTLSGPPWQLEIDFGAALTTHELTAVARDAGGFELDRAVQRINVPRPAVESEILLAEWRHGAPLAARLLWHSREVLEPAAIHLSLDGAPLSGDDPEHLELPPTDPAGIHFLRAEIELSDGQVATAEAVFGGAFGSAVATELTAVPLVVEAGWELTVEDLQGRLTAAGEPLRVAAVEQERAEVVMVRDEAALPALDALDHRLRKMKGGRRSYRGTGLPGIDQLRVVLARPTGALHPTVHYSVFPVSGPLSASDGPLSSILAHLAFPDMPSEPGPQRLVDALAAAGARAAASQRRRAVVLLLADCEPGESQWSFASVRAYLSELAVPLYVWRFFGDWEAAAGPASLCADINEEIRSPRGYRQAIERLRRDLARQRIAWVEGRHLPRRIELVDGPAAARLAR